MNNKDKRISVKKEEAEAILAAAGVDDARLFELYLKTKAMELIGHALSMGATHRLSSFGSAVGCKLRVFLTRRWDDPKKFTVQEFIVVEYQGGGKSTRRANMNSNSANFQEVARLLDGYYVENEEFDRLEGQAYRLVLGDNGYWSLREGKGAK